MMKKAIAIFALPLFLAGCGGFNGMTDARSTPAQQHPITVDPQIVTYEIAAAPDKIALSLEEKSAVRSFARAFKERGHGTLNVSAPSGAPNTAAAITMAAEVGTVLDEEGIAHERRSHGGYRASSSNTNAPVILSFRRYVATPSPCGNWSEDYGYDPDNGTTPNFGCASQNNLAAMVADPADLMGPRDADPAYAGRRDVVLEKYRKGEVTASERSEQDSGQISTVAE